MGSHRGAFLAEGVPDWFKSCGGCLGCLLSCLLWLGCVLRPFVVRVADGGRVLWLLPAKVSVFLGGVVLRRVRVKVPAVAVSMLRVPLDLIGLCVGGAPTGGRGWAPGVLRVLGMVGLSCPLCDGGVGDCHRLCLCPSVAGPWGWIPAPWLLSGWLGWLWGTCAGEEGRPSSCWVGPKVW